MSHRNKRLPYNYYITPVLVLILLGLLLTGLLTHSHYKNFTDLTYSSFCAISQSINCDTVAQSPWSVFLNFPLALWGFFYYLFLLVLVASLVKNNPATYPLWKLLFFLNLLCSFTSLALAYISATKIHSFCILCISIYAVNFSLLFFTWLIGKRFQIPLLHANSSGIFSVISNRKKIYIPLTLLVIFFLLIKLFLPTYWQLEEIEQPANIETGITKDGHPWIGAKNPTLTIEVFSDYLCFQCAKMQHTVRQLVNQYPEKVRLIHHHYPMDHDFNPVVVPSPFHVGSGKMALLAIYAMHQGKFWEMNDALFRLGRSKKTFNIKTLSKQTQIPANELGLALTHPAIRKILSRDILLGMKKRVTGTPSFIIDNIVYTEGIPPHILQKTLSTK